MRITVSQMRALARLEAAAGTPETVRKRCRIVRFWALNRTVRQVAAEISASSRASTSTRTVQKWVTRYRAGGLSALERNLPRGRSVGALSVEAAVSLEKLGKDPRVTCRAAASLVGVPASTVHRFWRKRGLR